MTTPVLPDAALVAINWLRALLPTILPGSPAWTCGNRIAAGTTPTRFVLVKVLGDNEQNRVSSQAVIAFQIWGPNGVSDDSDRTRAGRVIRAHAKRGLRSTGGTGPIRLPDPTDPSRSISQVTVQALLRGADE